MNKDLKEPIHVIVSPKGFGKTYYEFKKIIKENERLKKIKKYAEDVNNKRNELEERIDNAIDYIYSHYDLGTEENVEFCILRDRVLGILTNTRYIKR